MESFERSLGLIQAPCGPHATKTQIMIIRMRAGAVSESMHRVPRMWLMKLHRKLFPLVVKTVCALCVGALLQSSLLCKSQQPKLSEFILKWLRADTVLRSLPLVVFPFFPCGSRERCGGLFCRNILRNTSASIHLGLIQLHLYKCYKYISSLHAWSLDLLLQRWDYICDLYSCSCMYTVCYNRYATALQA